MPAEEHAADNPLLAEFWPQPSDVIDSRLAELRSTGGVTFHTEEDPGPDSPLSQGPGGFLLTRHADVLEASKNPEIFSSAKGITVIDTPEAFTEFFSSIIAMDDPRHARLRRIVSAGFTPRMLQRLEHSVQTVAASIIDGIAERGEVDFVAEVAAALPLKIVCDLMGIPESEYRFVFDRSNVILGIGDPEYQPEDGDLLTALLTAGGDLAGLMNEVAQSKAGGDGDDLTSKLMNADLGDDKLSDGDLASFFILLVVAGNETTRNAISWGLKFLTDNPDQRQAWAADFEGLAPSAVEEIVRVASPVLYMRRSVTADTEINGVPVPAGSKVALSYYAANRDPEIFDDPLRFDIGRTPNPHVGFGGPGPHFCLGAHLARREIHVMFRELFRRLPDIEATGEADVLKSSFVHGVKRLPARFTPTSPVGG